MWLKRSLLTKLLVGMLIATIIPLTVSTWISYRSTSSSVQGQVIDLNQQAMTSSMYYLKRYLDDLDQISISFYFDPSMMSYLRSNATEYNQRMYISNQIYTISKERPEFQAVQFAKSLTGETFSNSAFLQLGEANALSTGSTPESDRAGWTETHGYEVVSANGGRLLAFHKPIIDYPRPTQLGVLSIYVGLSEIERIVDPSANSGSYGGASTFVFIREDRQLLYASNADAIASADKLAKASEGAARQGYGSGELHWNGESGVMVYVADEYKGIPVTLVKFIPSAVVNAAANEALKQSLAVPFALIAVVVLAASVLLYYFLISPVKRLVRSVAHVQSGNFDMKPAPARGDELGVLEQRFHSMVRGLDDLMNREYRNRLELSTARLKMLQAQINPHFLYNSLQSIGTLALRRGVAEINDKIAELGSILRYSMDIRTEFVPLAMEIEHIENYLSLQSGRFKNKLIYEISCPPEALGIEVPKMILQPLAENSIIHGIEKGNGAGAIRIGIELGEELVIRVTDNGRGMEAETLERIRKEYGGRPAANAERGIGLINVLERLRLRYGSGFAWDIRSAPYEETAVTLRILLEAGVDEATEETNREEDPA